MIYYQRRPLCGSENFQLRV